MKEQGHNIIGISTKNDNADYDTFHTIEKYDFSTFPMIDGAIDGLVYFPGTINLKPFNRLTAIDFLRPFRNA